MAQLYFKGYEPDTADAIRADLEVTRRYYAALEGFNGLVADDQEAQYRGIAKQANYLDSLSEATMKESKREGSKLSFLMATLAKLREKEKTTTSKEEKVAIKEEIKKIELELEEDDPRVKFGPFVPFIGLSQEDVNASVINAIDSVTTSKDLNTFGFDGTDVNFLGSKLTLTYLNAADIIEVYNGKLAWFDIKISGNITPVINLDENPELTFLTGTKKAINFLIKSKIPVDDEIVRYAEELINAYSTEKWSFLSNWKEYIRSTGFVSPAKGSVTPFSSPMAFVGSGLSVPDVNKAITNELNINLGALEAGNHNRKIVARAFKLIDQLYQNNQITKAERAQLEARVEAVFKK